MLRIEITKFRPASIAARTSGPFDRKHDQQLAKTNP